jgi:hypothetical protein
MQQLNYNNMGGCEERTRARKAEESPQIEAIARKQLVKTPHAVKSLNRFCGDL